VHQVQNAHECGPTPTAVLALVHYMVAFTQSSTLIYRKTRVKITSF
jgi:hypothetical protein